MNTLEYSVRTLIAADLFNQHLRQFKSFFDILVIGSSRWQEMDNQIPAIHKKLREHRINEGEELKRILESEMRLGETRPGLEKKFEDGYYAMLRKTGTSRDLLSKKEVDTLFNHMYLEEIAKSYYHQCFLSDSSANWEANYRHQLVHEVGMLFGGNEAIGRDRHAEFDHKFKELNIVCKSKQELNRYASEWLATHRDLVDPLLQSGQRLNDNEQERQQAMEKLAMLTVVHTLGGGHMGSATYDYQAALMNARDTAREMVGREDAKRIEAWLRHYVVDTVPQTWKRGDPQPSIVR
ncbi:MAG: hypothetical protein ACOYNL_07190 [Rickettsiales bacterium]